MSSRPLLRPQAVASAVSMTVDGFSTVTNINMISAFGYTLAWGSGASGTFQVEVSNDYVPAANNLTDYPANAGTWVPLTLSNIVQSTGTSGTAYIDVVGISAAWARLHFVHSSGSGGTFTATLAGKVE